MHTTQDQQKLDTMTSEEKNARTSLTELRKRGVVILVTTYRVVAHNEMPHTDRGPEQYVLRRRHLNIKKEGWREFYSILSTYAGYNIIRHTPKDKSVQREHRHIYK